jgi:catechol 2,3-dioxygenase-like lactoylglutathione lyase family enzyme
MLGIHHAGIVVSDLDRAIDFYTGVLGLELMAELTPPNSGPWLERVLNLPGARLHGGAMLRAGASAIELHEFEAPDWDGPTPVPAHAIGAQHVAFWSTDLAAEKAAIEARGGTFMTDIHVVDTGPFAGLRTAFLQDPDGIRIEFVEVAYWLDEQRRAGVAAYWARRAAADHGPVVP